MVLSSKDEPSTRQTNGLIYQKVRLVPNVFWATILFIFAICVALAVGAQAESAKPPQYYQSEYCDFMSSLGEDADASMKYCLWEEERSHQRILELWQNVGDELHDSCMVKSGFAGGSYSIYLSCIEDHLFRKFSEEERKELKRLRQEWRRKRQRP